MINKYGRDARAVPLFAYLWRAKEIAGVMKWGAVIVAAGRGKRMGASDNKVFLPLAGRAVLAHALDAFERCGLVEEIVVVAAADEIERVKALVRGETDDARLEEAVERGLSADRREGGVLNGSAAFAKVSQVVAGGAERQGSVEAGLLALATDGVLVHDAARPLVTPELIAACCEAAERVGAAAAAVPVKDTIKVVEGGMIVSTPERASLLAVQTPQAFGRQALLDAHRAARAAQVAATDDAMLFERLGLRVAAVPGQESNLKITTPEDLLVAELIVERRRRGTGKA